MEEETTTILPLTEKEIYKQLFNNQQREFVFWGIIYEFVSLCFISKEIIILNNKYFKKISRLKQYIFKHFYKVLYDRMRYSLFNKRSLTKDEKNNICNIILSGEKWYYEVLEDKKLFDIKLHKKKINYNSKLISKYRLNLD